MEEDKANLRHNSVRNIDYIVSTTYFINHTLTPVMKTGDKNLKFVACDIFTCIKGIVLPKM